MRERQCDSCNYAAYKGEPVFSDCKNCVPDRCDGCKKRLGSTYLAIGGLDYHLNCTPVKAKARSRK